MPIFTVGCAACDAAGHAFEAGLPADRLFTGFCGHSHLMPANETAGEEIEAKRAAAELLAERRLLAAWLRSAADLEAAFGTYRVDGLRRAADLLDPDGPEGL